MATAAGHAAAIGAAQSQALPRWTFPPLNRIPTTRRRVRSASLAAHDCIGARLYQLALRSPLTRGSSDAATANYGRCPAMDEGFGGHSCGW